MMIHQQLDFELSEAAEAASLAERQRARMLLVVDAWRRARPGVGKATWASAVLWFSLVEGCEDVLSSDDLAALRRFPLVP